MTKRKLNYTKRKKIPLSAITVNLEATPKLKVKEVNVDCGFLEDHHRLVLEVTQHRHTERIELGTVGAQIIPGDGALKLPFDTSEAVKLQLYAKEEDQRWVGRSARWEVFGGAEQGNERYNPLKFRADSSRAGWVIDFPSEGDSLENKPTIIVHLASTVHKAAFGQDADENLRLILYRGVLGELINHLHARRQDAEEGSWEAELYTLLMFQADILEDSMSIVELEDDDAAEAAEKLIGKIFGGELEW
jgi:hypothetical protein